MNGSREGNAGRLISQVADICGICAALGVVALQILRTYKVVQFDGTKQPIVLGAAAAAIAGLALLAYGITKYFRWKHQFQKRSPWSDLIVGLLLILVALGGWQAITATPAVAVKNHSGSSCRVIHR